MVQAVGDGLFVDVGDRSLPDLVGALCTAATAEPVGIGWSLDSEQVNGVWHEHPDPTISGELSEALRADTAADWAARHPDGSPVSGGDRHR